MRAKNSRQMNGFTLAELMIVLTVIGILAAVSLPIARVYKEKTLIAQGQMGASCLQTALKSLDGMPADEQNTTLQELGGSAAQFYQAAEDLGCQLGPTPESPDSKSVLAAPGSGCIKFICRDGAWWPIPCSSPDNGEPGCIPPSGGSRPAPSMTFSIPEVGGTQIHMTGNSIEVLRTH